MTELEMIMVDREGSHVWLVMVKRGKPPVKQIRQSPIPFIFETESLAPLFLKAVPMVVRTSTIAIAHARRGLATGHHLSRWRNFEEPLAPLSIRSMRERRGIGHYWPLAQDVTVYRCRWHHPASGWEEKESIARRRAWLGEEGGRALNFFIYWLNLTEGHQQRGIKNHGLSGSSPHLLNSHQEGGFKWQMGGRKRRHGDGR